MPCPRGSRRARRRGSMGGTPVSSSGHTWAGGVARLPLVLLACAWPGGLDPGGPAVTPAVQSGDRRPTASRSPRLRRPRCRSPPPPHPTLQERPAPRTGGPPWLHPSAITFRRRVPCACSPTTAPRRLPGRARPAFCTSATDADDFDLGLQPLDRRRPAERARPHRAVRGGQWDRHPRVGVPRQERGDPDRRRHRVHVVSRCRAAAGTRTHPRRGPRARRPPGPRRTVGEQVDLSGRVLRLPTDPAAVDASAYSSIQSLAELVAADPHGRDHGCDRRPPGMQLLRRGTAPDRPHRRRPHRVPPGGHVGPHARPGGPRPLLGPRPLPGRRRWLDDGSFARFVLNRCPPLHLLKARLDAHLPGDVVDGVLDLLDDLGVPDTTWPDLVRRPRPAA